MILGIISKVTFNQLKKIMIKKYSRSNDKIQISNDTKDFENAPVKKLMNENKINEKNVGVQEEMEEL